MLRTVTHSPWWRLRFRLRCSILLQLLTFAPAFAQTPTFRAGTKLVEVDVVVRRGSGAVTGLTKDDFTVFDNGKPQKIAFYSVRSRSVPGSAPAPLPTGFICVDSCLFVATKLTSFFHLRASVAIAFFCRTNRIRA